MSFTLPYSSVKNRALLLLGVVLLLVILTHPAFASNAGKGGGLPFDTWFNTIKSSMTGPFAFTTAIVGLVGAGAMLIFGGDMNGFLRTLIFIVLVLSFLVTAENTLNLITGGGAEITAPLNVRTNRLHVRFA